MYVRMYVCVYVCIMLYVCNYVCRYVRRYLIYTHISIGILSFLLLKRVIARWRLRGWISFGSRVERCMLSSDWMFKLCAMYSARFGGL